MTVKEKLEESRNFLDLINSVDRDLQKLRSYVSAFLTSIRSMRDHTLQEANHRLSLGIKEDKLTYNSFCNAVKQKKYQRSLDFLTWFDNIWNPLLLDPILKDIHKLTNSNIHGHEIVFEIQVFVKPRLLQSYEKPVCITLSKTIMNPHYNSFNEIQEISEYTINEYVKEINKKREEHGDAIETSPLVRYQISLPKLSGGSVHEVCESIFKVMETYSTEFHHYKESNWR